MTTAGTNRSSSSAGAWVLLLLGIALIGLAAWGYFNGSVETWVLKQPYHKLPEGPQSHQTARVAGIVICSVSGLIGLVFVVLSARKPSAEPSLEAAAQAVEAGPAPLPKVAPRAAAKRLQSCNVLQHGEVRQLWNFNAAKSGLALNTATSTSIAPADPLPEKLVAKDWKVLFQPRLNIACLPTEKAFLRVLHLPLGSLEETLSMVDLQLEKISPLPTTQIVWSVEVLPHHADTLQTVIVVIVSRDLVEEYLGKLEGMGYLADRLEVPFLDQLLATQVQEDGAWVYPSPDSGKYTALVAWWYGGVLRSVNLLHVADVPERSQMLGEQLRQMAWAGELEGWLTSDPRWHLVADEVMAAKWQPMFAAWMGHAIETQPTLAAAEHATMTANRAARSGVASTILPPEFADRYRQQFIDRLWMGSLTAVLGAYVLGAVIYFAISQVQGFRADNLDAEMHGLSGTYTNTLQLKAQLKILQDRKDLKFASLDCWKKTAELLPEGLVLKSMDFRNGKTLSLNGTAPADGAKSVIDFNDALRKATVLTADGELPLFESMELPLTKLEGGGTLSWSFNGELARGESQ